MNQTILTGLLKGEPKEGRGFFGQWVYWFFLTVQDPEGGKTEVVEVVGTGAAKGILQRAVSQNEQVIVYGASEQGRKLARCIQDELVKNCRTVDRGIKTNDEWTVLTETACPAVLVELAFLSNDEDRAQLTDHFLQRQFAVGVMNGIAAFAKGGPLFSGVPEEAETPEVRGLARNR